MRKIRDIKALSQEIKTRVDMVKIVSTYVPLKKRGHNFFGLCPFHADGTPSFNVSPAKSVWSCLGCRESGDLFTFVQRMEGVGFGDAVAIIAKAANVDLSAHYRPLTADEELLEQRYSVMQSVADHMHRALVAEPEKVRFFADRGLTIETLEKFKIGFCPNYTMFEQLVPDAAWQDVVENDAATRRRIFGGHLLYPQFTSEGKVWGFYARTGDAIKYVGPSRGATLFQGEARLYGLSQSRPLVRKSELPLVIVEGFHDAMACEQAGIPAVAACGTEISDEQVKALQNHAIRKAIVVFDGDEGGEAGMLRLALRDNEIKHLDLKFARIPGDPDEFLATAGADAFRNVLQKSVCAIESVVANYRNRYVPTPTGNADFLNHVKPFVLKYPRGSFSRTIGVQAVASVTGISPEIILDEIESSDLPRPLSNPRAEEILLAEFALNPQAFTLFPDVVVSDFSTDKHRRLYSLIERVYRSAAEVNIELLATEGRNASMDSNVLELIDRLPSITRSSPEAMRADVADKAMRRGAVEVMERKKKNIVDLSASAPDAISELVHDVGALVGGRRARASFSSVEAVASFVAEFERRSTSDERVSGLDAGADWSTFMGLIDGFRPGRMHIVAAASSHGKSLVGSNFVTRLSMDPKGPMASGLIVSMEMTKEENLARMLAIDSGVPHEQIERAQFNREEDMSLVMASLERARSMRLTWMEGQKTVPDIAMAANALHMNGDLDYILVDYIQMLDLSPYGDRMAEYEKYGKASQDLLAISQRLNVPLICMAQLNRTALGEDTPTGAQMGSCYKIVQDAHVVFTLAKRKNGLLGFLDKNRGGQSQVAFDLAFDQNKSTATLRVNERHQYGNEEDQ